MEKPCFRYTEAKWKAQKKNEFRDFHLDKLKNNEFNHWISFSPYGSGPGTGLGFLVQNFVQSSGIGTARSGRPELRTY